MVKAMFVKKIKTELAVVLIVAGVWLTLGVVLFASFEKNPVWQPRESAEAEIKRLIGELGHGSFKVRDTANKRLAEIGVPALDLLYKAEENADLETKQRAAMLIKAIRIANTKVVEKFIAADVQAWQYSGVDLPNG